MFWPACGVQLDGQGTNYHNYGWQLHAKPIGDAVAMRMVLPVGRSGWAIAAGYAFLFFDGCFHCSPSRSDCQHVCHSLDSETAFLGWNGTRRLWGGHGVPVLTIVRLDVSHADSWLNQISISASQF